MRSLLISGIRQVGLIEEKVPVPQDGEVLLKINYVGFCGSDLNTFLGKNPMVKMPVIPGHEISATVAKVTPSVPATIREGTACTVNPYTSCGGCTSCRNGRVNACRFNQTLGVQRDGAMRDYMVVPWNKVIVDEAISSRDLALVEPLSIGFHAVGRARVTDGDSVMVIGCGMIGMGAIIRSVRRGAEVIAVDLDDEKLKLARRLGAKHTINSALEEVHPRLNEVTGEMGPDVVIEAVGVPATYRMAVDEVAFTGRVVCIGYASQEVAFETKLFVSKELDIMGSRNALPADFHAVMQHVKQVGLPDEFITATYSPDKGQEALEQWAANTGKVFRILVEF